MVVLVVVAVYVPATRPRVCSPIQHTTPIHPYTRQSRWQQSKCTSHIILCVCACSLLKVVLQLKLLYIFPRGRCTHFHAKPSSYEHRPSHPYIDGTEHVGFLSTRQAPSESGLRRVKKCKLWRRNECMENTHTSSPFSIPQCQMRYLIPKFHLLPVCLIPFDFSPGVTLAHFFERSVTIDAHSAADKYTR